MQKITTFLTFDDQAEEAIDLCTSIFPDSRIVTTTPSPGGGPLPKGSLLSATFELAGQRFMALTVVRRSSSPLRATIPWPEHASLFPHHWSDRLGKSSAMLRA